ncbi:hypothetical protein D3C72_1432050 [compost metagenome]
MGQVGCHASADAFTQAQTVASIALGGSAQVSGAIRGMGELPGNPLSVVRKSAAGHHHTTSCADVERACAALDTCTDHTLVLLQQLLYQRIGQQADVSVQCAFQQPGDQCIAVHQVHAAAVAQQVTGVAQQAFAGIQH